jgi:hypothetical protein
MPIDAALELARRVGFEPQRSDEPTIEEAGSVLRTEPAAGTQAELPARLVIVASAGGLEPPDTTPAITEPIDAVEPMGKVLRDDFEAERND